MFKRWAALLLLICMIAIVGCAGGVTVQSTKANTHNAQVVVGTSTLTLISATDTPIATATPGSGGTTQPTPTDTPGQSPSYHACNAQNGCPNPWGYVLGCSCGNMWAEVTSTPDGFCSYFQCIPNFFNESGSIAECGDGMFSHAGGYSGACSGHDGELAILYYYSGGGNNPTPTPQPPVQKQPAPTPTSMPPTPTPAPTIAPTPVPTP